MALRQGADRRLGMGQQFGGGGQDLASRGHQLGYHRGLHPPSGNLDRGFDHRQDKAFHAETVMADIAPLGRQQAVVQVVCRGIIGQQGFKPRLRVAEMGLVGPERVVGIKSDGGQHMSHAAN